MVATFKKELLKNNSLLKSQFLWISLFWKSVKWVALTSKIAWKDQNKWGYYSSLDY